MTTFLLILILLTLTGFNVLRPIAALIGLALALLIICGIFGGGYGLLWWAAQHWWFTYLAYTFFAGLFAMIVIGIPLTNWINRRNARRVGIRLITPEDIQRANAALRSLDQQRALAQRPGTGT